MSDYSGAEEKLKSNFEKPNFSPYYPGLNIRERGIGLTLFLGIVIAANLLLMTLLGLEARERSDRFASSPIMPLYLMVIAVTCAVVVCSIAIWNWKKWGYYGLIAVYVLEIGAMIFFNNVVAVGSAVVGLVLLVVLVNNKLDVFD
jgi:hypothetical protein